MIKFKIIVAAIIFHFIGFGFAHAAEPPIPLMPNTIRITSPEHATFYLKGPIDEQTLKQLIDFYVNPKAAKTLDLIIDSEGGRLKPTLELIDLMLANTTIKTSCKVEKMAASAAATILMACDKITLDPKSVVVYHLPHMGIYENMYLREGSVSEAFANYMNETFCFNIAVGDTVYTKFIFGYDIYYSFGDKMQSVIDKSCRLRNGKYEIGHG